MDPAIHTKYLRFKDREEVHKDPNMRWCPLPDCEGKLQKPETEDIKESECNKCHQMSCFYCLQKAHPG